MINRTYFVSAKVAHNNNTGKYSYYNGVIHIISWLPKNADEIVIASRGVVKDILDSVVDRDFTEQDVELLALNKL